jgi:hypothetical protein
MSHRIHGGSYALISSLLARLPAEFVRNGVAVSRVDGPGSSADSPDNIHPDNGTAILRFHSISFSSRRLDLTTFWQTPVFGLISASIVTVTTATGDVFRGRRAVLAVPPRMITERINMSPPLPRDQWSAMQATYTWSTSRGVFIIAKDNRTTWTFLLLHLSSVAAVTKIVLTFPTRFWPVANGFSNTSLRGYGS